jgi:hypothetical protein
VRGSPVLHRQQSPHLRRHDAKRLAGDQDQAISTSETRENMMPVTGLLAATAVDAYTLTADRVVATAAAVVALAAAIIGGLALLRPIGRSRKRTSIVALVTGMAGIVVGGLVVATADGGPGTGNGIVGGYAALAFGLIGVVLGGLALTRTRAAARTDRLR